MDQTRHLDRLFNVSGHKDNQYALVLALAYEGEPPTKEQIIAEIQTLLNSDYDTKRDFMEKVDGFVKHVAIDGVPKAALARAKDINYIERVYSQKRQAEKGC